MATTPSGQILATQRQIPSTPKAGNRADAARPFAGLLDEIRISSLIRSDDWIKFTYNTEARLHCYRLQWQ